MRPNWSIGVSAASRQTGDSEIEVPALFYLTFIKALAIGRDVVERAHRAEQGELDETRMGLESGGQVWLAAGKTKTPSKRGRTRTSFSNEVA